MQVYIGSSCLRCLNLIFCALITWPQIHIKLEREFTTWDSCLLKILLVIIIDLYSWVPASSNKELEADYWSLFIVSWEPQAKGPKGGRENLASNSQLFPLMCWGGLNIGECKRRIKKRNSCWCWFTISKITEYLRSESDFSHSEGKVWNDSETKLLS